MNDSQGFPKPRVPEVILFLAAWNAALINPTEKTVVEAEQASDTLLDVLENGR